MDNHVLKVIATKVKNNGLPCPQGSGLEISENRHLPCITKFIGIHGENLIFSRNIKIFTCPAA